MWLHCSIFQSVNIPESGRYEAAYDAQTDGVPQGDPVQRVGARADEDEAEAHEAGAVFLQKA